LEIMMRGSALSEMSLRRLVRWGLFPLRVIAAVYWLSLGWFVHRLDREERQTLRIARAAAACRHCDLSQPAAAKAYKKARSK
jgi:hypothetical protein